MGMGFATRDAAFNNNYPRMQHLKGSPALYLLAFMLALGGCSPPEDSALDRIKRAGEVRVLTYESVSTYYETPEGPAGFEYDLARAFADHLGVQLRLVVASRYADVLPRLRNGEADFAAAGLADTEFRRDDFRFSPAYKEVRQQIVYRHGMLAPTSLKDLADHEIEVAPGSDAIERLSELKETNPELTWTESPDRNAEELLQLVWEGLLDMTVADSNTVTVNRQYFPELQVAMELPKPHRLAWAFPKSDDTSLYKAATEFLKGKSGKSMVAQLTDRYYGPAARSNFINLAVYRLRIQNRLPEYRPWMEAAAKKHGLDWRLIAALGYQESYWDSKSVSPTGVRGFMMLTRSTAEELGVVDREDPAASIEGGARYLRHLLDRIPKRVQMPDRLWFALAAYNVGLAHLEDARILTQKQGGDPDRWTDVKQRLPLLADPTWYTQTKYGYARGEEPVRFVNRVRTYYDVLARVDEQEKTKRLSHALQLKAPAI
jgi:membrane-bound lytic murein transglycosylase F